MTPIGKGARFLVMGGDYRGREGVIVAPVADSPGLWWLNVEGSEIVFEQSDADGPNFKRLPDAPAEVDALYAEIDALDLGTRRPGAGGIVDEMRSTLDAIEVGIDDEDWDVVHRAAFVEIAALALAGIRAIDGR